MDELASQTTHRHIQRSEHLGRKLSVQRNLEGWRSEFQLVQATGPGNIGKPTWCDMHGRDSLLDTDGEVCSHIIAQEQCLLLECRFIAVH